MAKGLVSAGNVFNNWTVISEAERDSKRAQQFLCKCVCGTERVVKKYNLGVVKGCGCDRDSYTSSGKYAGIKKRSAKAKAKPVISLSIMRPNNDKVEPPEENNTPRPEYKERRKCTRELIEERKEQARLNRLLKEEWAL